MHLVSLEPLASAQEGELDDEEDAGHHPVDRGHDDRAGPGARSLRRQNRRSGFREVLP